MLFPTVDFALFFVAVFAISWLIRPWHLGWRLFLVGASWFFYGFWEPRFVFLLVVSTGGNWLLGQAVARERGRGVNGHGRAVLAAGVALNLGTLGWFKYYGFFATSVVNGAGRLGLDVPVPLMQVTLPIAISFFTFHAISYLADIHSGRTAPMRLLDFALYLSFFPHLVAGPIVRVTEFAPQLRAPFRRRLVEATPAFHLILAGLFKKVVISSYLAGEIADPVFSLPGEHSAQEILIGVYAYAVQIYADFSGYTDIAIGCALLLGLRFPQNFDSPYRARSLQEFWRRWHMTLSRWLRDYLYIPLGGNRGGRWRTARNAMLTMVLGGLWHGAAWTFVAWGALHGAGQAAEREIRERARVPAAFARPAAVLAWLAMFHFVCLAWIFFRAESFGLALEMLGRLFTAWGPSPAVTPLLVAVIAGSIAAQFAPPGWTGRLQAGFARMPLLPQAAALGAGLVFVEALGPRGVAPFIYFQF